MRGLLVRLTPYIWKLLTNREMVNFPKRDFFSIFLYTFTINCDTTGARKMPIDYIFALFVESNV